MSKRTLLALLLTVFVAGGLAAQSLWSMGAGLLFDGGGIGSVVRETWRWQHETGDQVHQVRIQREESARHFGFGGWAFVDSTFVELSFGVLRGFSSLDIDGNHSRGSFTSLDITLLGKLPFYLGRLDVFPLLGIGYSLMLAASLADEGTAIFDRQFRFNTIRIKFGLGGDLDLRRDVFIRASILGSYRYPHFARYDYYHERISGRFGVTMRVAIGLRL